MLGEMLDRLKQALTMSFPYTFSNTSPNITTRMQCALTVEDVEREHEGGKGKGRENREGRIKEGRLVAI